MGARLYDSTTSLLCCCQTCFKVLVILFKALHRFGPASARHFSSARFESFAPKNFPCLTTEGKEEKRMESHQEQDCSSAHCIPLQDWRRWWNAPPCLLDREIGRKMVGQEAASPPPIPQSRRFSPAFGPTGLKDHPLLIHMQVHPPW